MQQTRIRNLRATETHASQLVKLLQVYQICIGGEWTVHLHIRYLGKKVLPD
jgi:hypothetical protein